MDRLQKQIIGRNPPILHGEYYPSRIVLSSADNRSPPYEEPGGTCALGDGGMLYPDLVIGDKEPRPIGKWGRMHMKYLEAEHPGLYIYSTLLDRLSANQDLIILF